MKKYRDGILVDMSSKERKSYNDRMQEPRVNVEREALTLLEVAEAVISIDNPLNPKLEALKAKLEFVKNQ